MSYVITFLIQIHHNKYKYRLRGSYTHTHRKKSNNHMAYHYDAFQHDKKSRYTCIVCGATPLSESVPLGFVSDFDLGGEA